MGDDILFVVSLVPRWWFSVRSCTAVVREPSMGYTVVGRDTPLSLRNFTLNAAPFGLAERRARG